MTTSMTITTTPESWFDSEFGNANLGDVRRTERLIEMATTLGENPQASLPEACCDAAELKATYRFFDNDKISPCEILKSHILASINRLAQYPIILAIQDTTYLDWTAHPETEGKPCFRISAGLAFALNSRYYARKSAFRPLTAASLGT